MCEPFLKPEHQSAVSGLVRAVTREAVSTYLAPGPRQQPSLRCAAPARAHALPRAIDSSRLHFATTAAAKDPVCLCLQSGCYR